MNQQLCEKLSVLEKRLYAKVTHAMGEEEKASYDMFGRLVKEMLQLVIRIEEMALHISCRPTVLKYQANCDDIIDETVEILEELIEMPFKVILGKKLYESIEDQMADLDDCIEIINEELVDDSKILPYIETWDIGIFLE